MIKYTTQVDTVVLQIDLPTSKKQAIWITLIRQWVEDRKVAISRFDKVTKNYRLYYGGTTLATISSGYSNSKYYISIKFAGLKRYNERIDTASRNCLMEICALINTNNNITFTLAELDIAMDVPYPFDNMLILCTKKSANVKYHELGEVQEFNYVPTTYIEKFDSRNKVRNASLRSYLYNKSAKEGLAFNLTRFELKLQNRYFNRFGFNVDSIMNALDRYYVMYYKNLNEKKNMIIDYNSYSVVAKREIDRLGLEERRIHPNVAVVSSFIQEINSVYVDYYGNIAFKNK